MNQIGRHMAFDQIPLDDSRVARVKPFGNSMLLLEPGEAFAEQDLLFDLESVFFQVDHPAVAAFSGRRFIDGYRWRRRFSLGVKEAE